MPETDEEDALLRSVALQNARTILLARQRAEEALERQSEWLRITLSSIGDAVISTDAEGRVTFLNGVAESLTGWSQADAVGRSLPDVFQIVHERTRQPVENPALRALREGIIVGLANHTILIARDGTERAIDDSAAPMRDGSGATVGAVLVFRDVTERKRTQDVLARDALLLACVRDSVVVIDLEGIVTYWNEGATRLFGLARDEMVGRHFAERFFEPTRTFIAAQISARAVDIERAREYEGFRADGSRMWIEAQASAVADADGRQVGILVLSHDVTERKRTEEALREADHRKDEFLALLAHELRNPLAPLRNGLQVMRLAAGDARAVADARGMMERQLGHMVRLIDDLLDVSRINSNKMELRRSRVLLADVLSSAVETARPLIDDAGHTLAVSLPPEPVALDADLTRLAQVFSNLLTNSAKYTESGGHIWFGAERRADDVFVSVRDDGIGIPAESLPNIFDMFSQVDRSIERATGGLGIGLALVKGLVEMHYGTVSVESAGVGKGSTFTVRLPALECFPAPETAETSEGGPVANGPRRRILVVDDNRDSANSLARLLTLLGNEVHTAHDGVEAADATDQFRPEIILMDVGMPRLNGYEATRRIREQPWGRSVIIIALTGWGQDGDRLLSSEAGCDGHLVKPVNLADLEKLLTELTGSTTRQSHRVER
jgi:PAS domain S-box-containing protein